MKTSTIVWIVVVILVLGGGWYLMQGSGPKAAEVVEPSTTTGVQGSTGQTNTGQQAAAPVVTVAHSAALGDYLVATNGMTLYRYTKDTNGVSNCSGACAAAWPPYVHTVAEPLVAVAGVAGVLATIARADGSAQLVYNGAPLYFWQSDTKPGDVTGQNVGGFVVVKP